MILCFFLAVVPFQTSDNKPTSPTRHSIERHLDIPYLTGKASDPIRHKLDLYLPKGIKNFPTMIFVHGGSWRSGNKNLYTRLGETFAGLGIATVIINYRLAPAVQFPAFAEDVAAAFAWTHANIAKYGGNPERLFLSGHSAGGHLVSLLAVDSCYLQPYQLTTKAIKGVIGISGVYEISNIVIFQRAFGNDDSVCRKASPINHIKPNLPPFLLLYGDKDFSTLDRMAEKLAAELRKTNNEVICRKIDDRNHYTIIINYSFEEDPTLGAALDLLASSAFTGIRPKHRDPCVQATLDFIQAHLSR